MLSFVVSLLGFIAQQAPHLIPELRKLVTDWGSKKGVPLDDLLPALDSQHVPERVKQVEQDVDALIAKTWPKT
jgi:hypothetical protein